MDREEIKNKLFSLIKEKELTVRLISVSYNLANSYKRKYTSILIKDLVSNYNIINNSRLNLKELTYLSDDELEILDFKDTFELGFGINSYMVVDLKNKVLEFVINNKKQIYDKIITLDEALEILKNKDVYVSIDKINNYQNMLLIKSLVYNLTYLNLLNEVSTELDLTRAGLFKNAYFDIMSIADNVLNEDKNSKRSM